MTRAAVTGALALLCACRAGVDDPARSAARASALLAAATDTPGPEWRPVGEGLEPGFPADADVRVRAHVAARAGEPTELVDLASGLSLRLRLRGAAPVAAHVRDGALVYPRALDGADLVTRATPRDLEDFVVFAARPTRAELEYEVELGAAVKGLRLVETTLEFLDGDGAPRLRVGSARIADAQGRWHEAALRLRGCAADESPAAPWGRPVTSPGASSCRVTFTWGELPYPAVLDPTWSTTLGTLVDRRGNGAAVLLGPTGKVLFAGGITSVSPNVPLASAELYDELTGTWARTGDLGFARANCSMSWTSSGGGRAVVAGGTTASQLLEIYNPGTGAWTRSTNGFSFAAGQDLNVSVTLTDGRVLVVGGQYADSSQGGCLERTAAAHLFNVTTNTLSATGSMLRGRVLHQATVLPDGRVLVAGGGGTCCPTGACDPEVATSELWSPQTGTWTAGPSMGVVRTTFAIQPLGANRFLVAGGLTNSFSNTVDSSEVYLATPDAGIGSFGTLRLMNGAGQLQLTTLPNGKVMFAGGWTTSANGSLRETQVYDPAANTWTTDSMLGNRRRGHAQVRTALGRTLVAGGASGTTNVIILNSSEIYDLLPQGSVCTGSGLCATGTCQDGRCCNTGCTGTCERCDTASGAGTCAPAAVGTPPRTTCGGYACDGVQTSCPTTCTDDQHCVPTHFCSANACVPKRGAGQACLVPTECASGFCVEGVCCTSACAGACDHCAASLGVCTVDAAGAAGTPSCSPYLCNGNAATCPTSCSSDANCVPTSWCDANGRACTAKLTQGAACPRDAACQSGHCVGGVCCDGACNAPCETCSRSGSVGSCAPVAQGTASTACGAYLCTGTSSSCPTSCSSSTECVNPALCLNSVCQGQKANGADCGGPGECLSGFCADRVCCNQACVGACDSCTAGTRGACTALPAASPGTPSCAPYLCDGTALACPASCTSDTQCVAGNRCINDECRRPFAVGSACGRPTDCQSGSCVDGVCCDSACDGACDHCNLSGSSGTCTAAPRGTTGAPSCAPYVCDGTGMACPTSCVTSADCTGLECVGSRCGGTKAPGEPCAAGFECATGECADGVCCDTACAGACDACDVAGAVGTCTPLPKGASPDCPAGCATDADCASGQVCSAGKCAAALRSHVGFSCGCSSPAGATLLLWVAALPLWRRRRGTS